MKSACFRESESLSVGWTSCFPWRINCFLILIQALTCGSLSIFVVLSSKEGALKVPPDQKCFLIFSKSFILSLPSSFWFYNIVAKFEVFVLFVRKIRKISCIFKNVSLKLVDFFEIWYNIYESRLL